MKFHPASIASLVLSLVLLAPSAPALADPTTHPDAPTIPTTRFELKEALERSKQAMPRLPLPPLSEDDRGREQRGERSVVNNGRMRRHYLPSELTGGGFTRGPDPAMTLGYPLQTMIFWVISRGNNCTYCLGHQESKLSAAGIEEDRIAALDGDWSDFNPAEQAAFALAARLTRAPHEVGPDDINRLQELHDDLQILEILHFSGNFNAMNRWTGALNIPQEDHREYLTPTPAHRADAPSRVAPLDPDRPDSEPACAIASDRPPLESRAEVEAALADCRTRSPRLPLLEENEAREVLPEGWPEGKPVPQWARLLANFPVAGAMRISMHLAAEDPAIGTLDPLLRAQVAWIAARQDRAWYALGHARNRLESLGLSVEEIFALDDPGDDFTPAERAAFALVSKLTADPPLVGDADVSAVREHFSDHEVAELIYQITEAAYFHRVTEPAGLRLED